MVDELDISADLKELTEMICMEDKEIQVGDKRINVGLLFTSVKGSTMTMIQIKKHLDLMFGVNKRLEYLTSTHSTRVEKASLLGHMVIDLDALMHWSSNEMLSSYGYI